MRERVISNPQGGYTSLSQRLQDSIGRWVGPEHIPRKIRIITDTSDFFRVDYGDVVILGGRPYLVRNNEREGRFGLDDEQKFWVKRSVDLETGRTKIIKLSFKERFQSRVGDVVFDCVRSPRKEARLLDLVRGHPRFMQGFSVKDEAGNVVRIIDLIAGPTLADQILTLGQSHEDYLFNYFPMVYREYIELVEAIKFLHDRGEKHGDIRRDHILLDKETGRCQWIDLDFNFYHASNPFGYDLFGLGNVLVYLAGQGDITIHGLRQAGSPVYYTLKREDTNVVFRNRVVNLKKLYPYLSETLNRILMHFSVGAEIYYETIEELLGDLHEAAL